MRRALLGVLVILTAPAAFAWGRGGVPDWLKAFKTLSVPSYPAATKGVVLLDETTTTVSDNGEVRQFRRVVIRVLNTDGRELGIITIPYDNETRIGSLHAWSITAAGEEFSAGDRDSAETQAFEGELYADNRVKVLRIPAAEPGNIIAYEFERRERPQSLQDAWHFQRDIPLLTARYALVLPDGWSHEERWFNSTAVAPQVAGNQVAWTLTNVAAVKDEPRRPSFRAVAARMAINFVPRQAQLGGKSHRSWDDVGRWYGTLANDRRSVTPVIEMKAKELAAGRTSAFDRAAALTAFVQREVRYVAIEIGIGGYQPHPSNAIFSDRFGDCKDKVTLLGAMLKAVGIDSYYVLVSTSRGVIDPQFATAEAMDHAIIAIRLPDADPSLPAMVKSTKRGALLLFDPTSETTPIGTLPVIEQENDVLLVTEDGGELLHVAAHPPESNRLTRSGKFTLEPNGTLRGEVRTVYGGALAAATRALLHGENESERKHSIEKLLSHSLSQFELGDIAVENLDDLTKDLIVRFRLVAPQYAKKAGGLLLVRPRVIGNKSEGTLDLKERTYAYESDGPALEDDDFEIALPPNVKPDELPDPVTASIRVASYRSETKVDGNVLRYHRQYRISAITIPPAELAGLNGLFTKIVSDERASAVLRE